MGDIMNIHGTGMNLSINQFCDETNCDNATIARRIKVARIQPAAKKGKLNLFALGDLIKVAYLIDDDGQPNPAGMDPFKRKAHYQAQQEEIRYLEECGELVPKIQMQEEMSRAAKVFVHLTSTLPDVLEQQCGLTPAQTQIAVDYCNKHRDECAEILSAEDAAAEPTPVRESA